MKAYIQADAMGDYYNVNAFIASVGFRSMGFQILKFVDVEQVLENQRDAIFVGGISNVRKRLKILGIKKEDEIEYPTQLRSFLNRNVWCSTLKQVIAEGKTGIFIKPVRTKLFQGKVIHEPKDFIGLNYNDEIEIWCSDIVDIVTEWRCFVRYGELLDVRYYSGKWDSRIDLNIVNDAIAAYKDQPKSFCLDFGVDLEGQHYLIEVNDGHSLGAYGMGAISYAKFLSARWSELTQTQDVLNF